MNTTTRVLKNTTALLTMTAYQDGTATDLGTFTIGITDPAGNTVVAAGTAVTDNADGTYEYSLAAQTQVDFLTVTWTESGGTVFTTYVEIVGGHLFTEAQARAFDNSALTNTTTYPDVDILRARDRITDRLEQWTGRSWIPRYRYANHAGGGGRWLALRDAYYSEGGSSGEGAGFDPISLISGTIGGTSITVGNVELFNNGMLYRTDGTWTRWSTSNPLNVTLEYEYGQQNLIDGVDRIALLLLRDELVATNISDRTSRFTDELGTYQFVTPGLGMAVSTIPEVNEWVRAHDLRLRVT